MDKRSGAIVGLGIPQQYFCKDCGYTGSIILEVPKSAVHVIDFKRIRRRRNTPVHERSTEILRPIYTTVLLIFAFAAVLFLIPKYEVFSSYDGTVDISKLGSSYQPIYTVPTTVSENQPAVQQPGISYISVRESAINDLDRAMGGSGVLGFTTPLFFLLFIAGFLMLMIASHWYRIRMFS